MTLEMAIMAALSINAAPRTREMYEYVCRSAETAGLSAVDVHDPQLVDKVGEWITEQIQRGYERKAEQIFVVVAHACPWLRSHLPRPRHRPRAPRVLEEDEAAHTCYKLPRVPPCGWRWRWPCPAGYVVANCAACDGPTLIFDQTSSTSATSGNGSPVGAS